MTEEMNKEDSHPLTSFSSLPDNVALNCLARISRFYYPTLSLVSKGFRSLIASPELEATRSLIGKPEDHLCVCLKLNKNNKNPNPCWFTVSPIPKQKLKPIPWFPHQYPQSPTVVSIRSEIYIIGGFVRRKRSRRVLILDSRSHQWRRLPKMRLPRASPAACVFNGKIHVIGGCRYKDIENWGEVYDPKTKTWEPLSSATLDLPLQSVYMNGLKPYLKTNTCVVKIDKVWCLISVANGILYWSETEQGFGWSNVKGVEQVSSNNHLLSVAVTAGGARVTVWWKSAANLFNLHSSTEECETHIQCAEISFERLGLRELCGFVEWSKHVFTIDGFDLTCDFFLHSAIVTY